MAHHLEPFGQHINVPCEVRKKQLNTRPAAYVPNSLLHAAFHLSEQLTIPLQNTVAMVSANVADMVGFHDRGELAPGKTADMLRVTIVEGPPVIRRVWQDGILAA